MEEARIMTDGALVAAINERVRSLDQDYQDLRKSFSNLDTKVEQQHAAVLTKLDAAFTHLTSKLEARSVTPWPTIWGGLSVAVAILVALGSAFYMPIRWEIDREAGQIEAARLRSYEMHGKISKLEQAIEDNEKRYNAISQRVITLINSLNQRP